jgi:thioredoxin-related protein
MLLLALPFLSGIVPDRAGPVALGDEPSAIRPLPGKETIQWLTLAQAEKKQAQTRKPILIDLYTDWCGWCKVMDKKTYARQEVAQYINEHFYPVKLDAEGRETLTLNGKQYLYNANARIHNLAIYLTGGQLSFPHTIFLMPGDQRPQAIPGYLEVRDMELLLKFFGEGHYGKTDFPDYQKKFSPSWK